MVGGSAGPNRSVALAIGVLVALFLAVAVAGQGAEGAAPAPIPGVGSTSLVLRLHDLPPGYVIRAPGNESVSSTGRSRPRDVFCDSLHPEHPKPALAEFLGRFAPAGCMTVYWRAYTVPGQPRMPPIIGTGALDAGSAAAAEAGLAVAPELLDGTLEKHGTLDEVPAPATIGDARQTSISARYAPGPTGGRPIAFLGCIEVSLGFTRRERRGPPAPARSTT